MKAVQKHIHISPQKLRLVADAVRSMEPEEALINLRFINKRGSKPIAKTIKQALANAKNSQGLTPDKLKFKVIQINKGPIFKRWRPVARGMAHSIKKQTSHIHIELEEKNGTKS